jgi:hypothetical protein
MQLDPGLSCGAGVRSLPLPRVPTFVRSRTRAADGGESWDETGVRVGSIVAMAVAQ